jgi:hypothetical protein
MHLLAMLKESHSYLNVRNSKLLKTFVKLTGAIVASWQGYQCNLCSDQSSRLVVSEEGVLEGSGSIPATGVAAEVEAEVARIRIDPNCWGLLQAQLLPCFSSFSFSFLPSVAAAD